MKNKNWNNNDANKVNIKHRDSKHNHVISRKNHSINVKIKKNSKEYEVSKNKPKGILSHIVGGVSMVFSIGFCGVGAFYIINFILSTFHFKLENVWIQFLTTLITFLLFALFSFIVSRIFKHKFNDVWEIIIEAIKRISSGDYDIDLSEINKRESNSQFRNNPMVKLVSSINTMAEELKELEEMRQEFISNVSHEIQSPLTSINGFAKALKNIDLGEEDRIKYLSIIEEESERLSKISDNLMKLTTLESKDPNFELQEFSLDKQIRNIVLAFEAQWSSKDIDIGLDAIKVNVNGDKDLLSQIWINLIGNSIKFTSENGQIDISVEKVEDKVIVKISDTGIGLSKEDKERVFERFYKADKSRNGKKGGSGLGLSIVKKIVEIHHGDIKVKSELGKGTTFIVTLPLNTPLYNRE